MPGTVPSLRCPADAAGQQGIAEEVGCVFRSKVISDSGGNEITFAVRTGMVQGA